MGEVNNNVLCRFYADLTKEDGRDYAPDSLRTILAALDRHLRENGASYSILNDKQFEKSHKVLNAQAIEIRELGKGKKPMKADTLTETKENLLWERKGLGSDDGGMLNRTVLYTLSQQFGTRGWQEHHDIELEHLKFVKDSVTHSTDYIEWKAGITKTRQGGLKYSTRKVSQKMFAIGGPKCPVALLELMVSKRPNSLKTSGPLYLQPLRKPKHDVWYGIFPVPYPAIALSSLCPLSL